MDDVRGDFLGPPHGTTPAPRVGTSRSSLHFELSRIKIFRTGKVRIQKSVIDTITLKSQPRQLAHRGLVSPGKAYTLLTDQLITG